VWCTRSYNVNFPQISEVISGLLCVVLPVSKLSHAAIVALPVASAKKSSGRIRAKGDSTRRS
jgi:hypothetical protein